MSQPMRLKAVLTLVAALTFVILSYVAPEFRGYTSEQLPFIEPESAVEPAGYAFAIWGVIYAWLVAGAAWGLWRHAEDPAWDRFRWPLILSMALGATWIRLAVYDPILATVVIWVMLGLAVLALWRTPAGDDSALWLARVPVGLLAGWLTAASCASLGLLLAGFGWLPSSRVAAWVVVPLAALLALAVLWRPSPAGAYVIAAGWGLVAIAVRNAGQNPDVVVLALAATVILVLAWMRSRRLVPQTVAG